MLPWTGINYSIMRWSGWSLFHLDEVSQNENLTRVCFLSSAPSGGEIPQHQGVLWPPAVNMQPGGRNHHRAWVMARPCWLQKEQRGVRATFICKLCSLARVTWWLKGWFNEALESTTLCFHFSPPGKQTTLHNPASHPFLDAASLLLLSSISSKVLFPLKFYFL